MQYRPDIPYPANEEAKLVLLESLFLKWHQHFADNAAALKKHSADDMVVDGFYPYYFSQKKRILFIGREARDISGYNYIDCLYRAYRDDKRVGKQSLNASKFHYRMLYIAYGILNGMPEWQKIPCATEIVNGFAIAEGFSFAFMNLCKLSNDSDDWTWDRGVSDVAHGLSAQGRNFTQEEIAILEPDIVITMNLQGMVATFGQLTPIHATPQARSYWLDVGGHRALLIDTYHFSAWKKGDIADYYVPICDAICQAGMAPTQ